MSLREDLISRLVALGESAKQKFVGFPGAASDLPPNVRVDTDEVFDALELDGVTLQYVLGSRGEQMFYRRGWLRVGELPSHGTLVSGPDHRLRADAPTQPEWRSLVEPE